jgi:hypothetical protein
MIDPGYIDPSSGSMILQVLLGGVAGMIVAMKMFGRRVLSVFTFWRRDSKDTPRAGAEDPAPTGAEPPSS